MMVALVPVWRGRPVRMWALALAAIFLLASLVAPKVLVPVSRSAETIGMVLHSVLNYFILGAFFYLIFTPFAWILRAAGQDFLRLRWAPEARSYWILRKPPGLEAEGMKNQF